MPECEDSKCHEDIMAKIKDRPTWREFNALKDAVADKIPKLWLWLGFVFVGLPLMAVGLTVWAGQTSDGLRYATKKELQRCEIRLERLEVMTKIITETLSGIRHNTGSILEIVSKDEQRSHGNIERED